MLELIFLGALIAPILANIYISGTKNRSIVLWGILGIFGLLSTLILVCMDTVPKPRYGLYKGTRNIKR